MKLRRGLPGVVKVVVRKNFVGVVTGETMAGDLRRR
jgi:hypothetical protein